MQTLDIEPVRRWSRLRALYRHLTHSRVNLRAIMAVGVDWNATTWARLFSRLWWLYTVRRGGILVGFAAVTFDSDGAQLHFWAAPGTSLFTVARAGRMIISAILPVTGRLLASIPTDRRAAHVAARMLNGQEIHPGVYQWAAERSQNPRKLHPHHRRK